MEIGSILHNRFAVTKHIGKGAMGAVFLAKDTQTGLDVALKVLAVGYTFDPDMIERFRREGEALKQLRHPNIVSFVDMFEWEGQQVIVMEYVPGGSLFQLIRRGPLAVDQARHITLDLCDALTRAHRLNIVHRDIKPENILLAQDGTPRLTDLGVARLVGEGTRLTGTGTQVGTPYYMSPEAWQGQHLDGQADIWSLGVVLYEMLTGQVPFGGETMVAVMNKVLNAPLPDIKAGRPDVPPDLAKIVRKMLTRDKAKRYQTMREVALDLERLNVSATSAASRPANAVAQPKTRIAPKAEPTQVSQTSQPPRRAAPTWIWLAVVAAVVGVVALIALGGGLGWIVYSSQQTARQTYLTQTAIWAANQATQLALNSASSQTPEPTATQPPTAAPPPTPQPTQAPEPTWTPEIKGPKVGLVIDMGGVNDKSFNQSAWEGAQRAAQEFGIKAEYIESKQPEDYGKIMDQFAAQGDEVIIAVGWTMADATAAKARQYPNIKFAIIDYTYVPTTGSVACPDTVKDCYSDGGLTNVTSLMYREDEAGFLAGVVAAGMSKAGTVCSVAGMEIPPVVRYVTGYQAGARWMRPDIKTPNVYIPSFIDPAKGHDAGLVMIGAGCDVLFGVGGSTGNGGLQAAKEKGLMAIGVDVDQYNTYPEVKAALVTSAMKNPSMAVYSYLKLVRDGAAMAGITTANLQNGGVGLAPYHDWDSKVPNAVKAKVQEAIDGLRTGQLKVEGAAGPTLKLALLAPLSGAVPTFGAATRDGAMLAIQQWNAKGGVLGKQIEVVVEDSQCSAEPGRNAANKVIDQDKVHYIIGEVCSKASIPISEIAQAKHVVQISPTSTNPGVTVNANGSTKSFIFRACFIDPFQGSAMANFALSKGYKTAFVMLDPDNSYIRGLAEFFITAFEKGGGKIVGKENYKSQTDTNFSTILSKVSAAKPDVLYLPDYYNIVNLVGKQAKQKSITAVMMGGDGWDSADLDVTAVDGGLYSNHYDPGDTRPAAQAWLKDFGAQHNGAVPDALATLAYDTTNLMLTAIQKAGVDDPNKVKDVLAAIQFNGVTGTLTFDAQHNPIKSVVIVQVSGGKKVYAGTVNP